MKNLLINREWDIQGNWYAPRNFLNDFKSVQYVDLINTCSSAGDWDGLMFQKIGNTIYLIPFSQSNNYPYSGFTLYTDNVWGELHCKLTQLQIDGVIQAYCDEVYAMYQR